VTDAATGFTKIVKMSIPFILTKKNINKNGFVRYAPSVHEVMLLIVLRILKI
jgi:hypothetical protein